MRAAIKEKREVAKGTLLVIFDLLGAELEVEPPKGTFVLPEDASRPLVFVAGGIGITPFRSMLRYIQDKGLPHRVTLISSNRDRESTPFLAELEEIDRA